MWFYHDLYPITVWDFPVTNRLDDLLGNKFGLCVLLESKQVMHAMYVVVSVHFHCQSSLLHDIVDTRWSSVARQNVVAVAVVTWRCCRRQEWHYVTVLGSPPEQQRTVNRLSIFYRSTHTEIQQRTEKLSQCDFRFDLFFTFSFSFSFPVIC